MSKRLKVLLTILVVLILVGAGSLIYFQNQLKSSADTMSSGFVALAHHPSSKPISPYDALKHHDIDNTEVMMVNPPSVTLKMGQTQQFQATINGVVTQDVTWKVAPTYSPDATVIHGKIDAKTGLYTVAKSTSSGKENVVATSIAKPSLTALSIVTILAPTTVLLKNGNFESGDNTWIKSSSYSFINSLSKKGLVVIGQSANCFGGKGWCTKLQLNNASQLTQGQNINSLTTGSYKLSAKFKILGGLKGSQASINLYDITAKRSYTGKTASLGTNAWQNVSVTVKVDASIANHKWKVVLYNTTPSAASIYYDEVKLEKL